jgi:hypothetical protein
MTSTTSPNYREYEFHEDSHDIRRVVNPFGLTDLPALLRQMYDTGAILAGGVAMNLCYAQIHPERGTVVHADSDLDFWVADPTPSPSHARRVYYRLICDRWDRFLLEAAGYEPYYPSRTESYTEDDEDGGFLSDSGIRLRVRHYRRPDPSHSHIQLIFYDATLTDQFPATTLVSRFDLSICRCLVFASAVNRRWIARTFAYRSLQEEVIATLGDSLTPRTEERVMRYLARYPHFTWYSRAREPTSISASG